MKLEILVLAWDRDKHIAVYENVVYIIEYTFVQRHHIRQYLNVIEKYFSKLVKKTNMFIGTL
jgi:hypothetical protein